MASTSKRMAAWWRAVLSGQTRLARWRHGNKAGGILVVSSHNTIGGSTSGDANLISGNGNGIEIDGEGTAPFYAAPLTKLNLVEGNRIGTDIAGTKPLGNNIGVAIFYATDNTIGGTVAQTRNLISGNGTGVSVDNDGSRRSTL